MRHMSYFIAFAHFGAICLDLAYGILINIQSEKLENATKVIMCGILTVLGVEVRIQFILFFIAASIMVNGMIFLFVGAVCQIVPEENRMMSKLISFTGPITSCIFLLILALPLYLLDKSSLLIDQNAFTMTWIGSIFSLPTISILSFMGASTGHVLLLLYSAKRYFDSMHRIMSSTTAKKQHLWIRNSLAQTLIPLIFIAVPFISIRIYYQFGVTNGAFSAITNFFQSFYGTGFTCTTIFVYQPYRKRIADAFRPKTPHKMDRRKTLPSFSPHY
ncbi:unnamed protein product, partial [Mesorhabditis belari]|uniref:Uncharacterized protein n=1 Tax=Mesorhabditis belari TaxID=2138241 RepID=A0AAF3EQV1_9BILA